MTPTTPETVRVAAVQIDVRIADKPHNLERILEFARHAARDGARLVVFPECAVTGYCFESREEALEYAEPLVGPTSASVTDLCRELDLHLVYGFLEEDGDRLFNCLALVGPGGVIASYRKVHLPHLGVDHFVDAGDRPFAVHDTDVGRLGMNICYDGAFPESARVLALLGVELILLPTNWPTGAEEFAVYGINTRALENTVYYLAANRVGTERGFRFIGLSRIVDTHGRTLAEADDESEVILMAEIQPALAREKRIDRVPGKHWINRIDDRCPRFYGLLAEEDVFNKASET